MKRNAMLCSLTMFSALVLLSNLAQAAGIVYGVGGAFPKQVYKDWGKEYMKQTGATLIYFGLGSGKGIEAIIAGKADFGASDAPMKTEDLEKNNLYQFPALIGGVVPVVNIANIGDGQLQMDGAVLADIYLGKIRRWNDPAIAALNPRWVLPNEAIKVLHRSDKSGTSFVFTDYLSKVSAEWRVNIGAGTQVSWKVGEGIEGFENLAQTIFSTPNSIGYLEPIAAQEKHLTFVKMRNFDGAFVSAGYATFAAAASKATWGLSNGNALSLTNMPGPESWPLSTATYIIVSRKPAEIGGAKDALKYFDWAFSHGGSIAQNLGFVSIPAGLMQSVREAWKSQIKDRAGAPLWP